jgi:acetoin utilization protein AcuB
MLVREVMTPNPVVIEPEMPVSRAQRLMKDEQIRHLPVVREGKGMVGLLTRDALNRAMPSELTSLSIWEINYHLGQVKAQDVMVKKVITVTEDVTVEEAARLMSSRKIGGLPVMRGRQLVGIVTEIDLLEALSNLMGWRQPGVRVTVQVADAKGELARVATAIAKAGGLLAGGGSYPSSEPLKARIVFKVRSLSKDELEAVLKGLEGIEILDIRQSHTGAG